MILIPIAVLLAIHLSDPRRRVTDRDLVAHARDFGIARADRPVSPICRSA